jgi:hypothetical protein
MPVKHLTAIVMVGTSLAMSSSAFSFSFNFNIETNTVYENIVPVEQACIDRVNNDGAIVEFQESLDGLLTACAEQASFPFLC